MEEERVSFETAKLAKEKGYNLPSTSWFNYFGVKVFSPALYKLANTPYPSYPRPTQSLLQKWLREVHKIDVNVLPYNKNKKYYEVWVEKMNTTWSGFKTYEQALEIGLQEALKLVKQ